jgi:type I restriction enzyme S subunit
MSEKHPIVDGSVRRYRAYPEYKKSGLAGLEEIPAHWEIRRLKTIASINDEALPEDTDPGLPILYVDISNVDPIRGILGKEELTFGSAPSRARRIVRDGDVIISTVRTYLRAITDIRDPDQNLIVSTGFAVVRPKKKVDGRFGAYSLRAPYFVDQVVASSVGVSFPAINASEIGCFPVALPPQQEQQAIAAFIERETGKIDELVAKKKQLVDLLQEKRSALIARAVTGGLNLRVPMKDTGVEWIARVPEHWKVAALSLFTLSRCDGPFGSELKSEHYSSSGVRVIRLQNIGWAQFRDDDQAYVETGYALGLGKHSVKYGDLLIAGLGDDRHPVGRACVAPEALGDAIVKADSFRFRLDESQVVPQFAAYQLSASATAAAGSLATGTTRSRMNLSSTSSRKLAIPPLAEQHEIIKAIAEEQQKIDDLRKRIADGLERLREFRTTLISAAVTGKIDVREGFA